jgi:hypothetical protein
MAKKEPSAEYVHCAAQNGTVALVTVFKINVSEIRKFYFYMEQLYNLFGSVVKRRHVLKN